MKAPVVLSLEDRGLDLILGGGVRLVERVPGGTGASVLLRGSAGAGKTLLGLHLAAVIARSLGGAVAYGCVEILPSELEAQLRSRGAGMKGVRVIYGDTESSLGVGGEVPLHLRLFDLREGVDKLGEVIERFYEDVDADGTTPKVLVIDSLSDGYKLGAGVEREFADAVCKLVARMGVVLILLEECVAQTPSPWVFAADTVLELGVVSEDADATRASPFERRLTVVKHRFGPSDFGPHRFSFTSNGDVQVYPRPSAWLEPWAAQLPAGVAEVEGEASGEVMLQIGKPLRVEGLVVAVHGSDLQQVLGIAWWVSPTTEGSVGLPELHLDLGFPLGRREEFRGGDRLYRRLGVAHPYLSAHRLLRELLDQVRSLGPLRRVIVGDMQSLRAFWGEDGLRRALDVFCILMRRLYVPVVLYESTPSRVSFVMNTPTLQPGLSEARAVDLADVSVEVMHDSMRPVAAIHKAVVTQRHRGTLVGSLSVPALLGASRLRLRDLLRSLLMRLPRELIGEVVVFGSGALVMRGVELGRVPDDLDLFVSDTAFNRLAAEEGFVRREKPGVKITFLTLQDESRVEIWKEFQGVDFAGIASRATTLEGSFGTKVASLEDLRVWERTRSGDSTNSAAAEKARADLLAIENALKER